MAKIEIIPLNEARKREIAFLILKDEFIKEQRNLDKSNFLRRIGTAAENLKELNISKDELISLYHEFITEGVENLFK